MKKNDYRKLYETAYNIKIPKNFDIHHIDLNHNNNDLDNLVMLPKDLHLRYHKALCLIPDNIFPTKELSLLGRHYNNFIIDTLYSFNIVLQECNKWLDYKEYLKGTMPNIHNIEV